MPVRVRPWAPFSLFELLHTQLLVKGLVLLLCVLSINAWTRIKKATILKMVANMISSFSFIGEYVTCLSYISMLK